MSLTKGFMMHIRPRSGYLLEIPLIVFFVGIMLAILLPRLPLLAGKFFVVAGAVVWIAGAFYMIVIPGWQPGNPRRLQPPWSYLVFLAVALLISFVAIAFVINR